MKNIEMDHLGTSLPDSDLKTPESTHDESVRRDPYQMELLKPLVDYFSLPQEKRSLNIHDPAVEIGLKHLEEIIIKADMGLVKPYGLTPDEGSDSMIMAGVFTRIFVNGYESLKGEDVKAVSSMEDWLRDIKEGKKPTIDAFARTGEFVSFVTHSREKYLDYIGIK